MSRIIKAGESRPAPPVYVGRQFDLEEETSDTPETASDPADKPEQADESPPASAPDNQGRQALEEALQKSKQIINSAQSYAAEQIQEARRKISEETSNARKRGYTEGHAQGLEQGKKDGYAAGNRAGYEEGQKQAVAENRKYIQELGLMIETVEKSKTKVLKEFETDLDNLAVAIADAIIKKELEIDDKAMRTIILNAMDAYRNQGWVRIYVSPNTANVLLKADNNIVEALKEVSDNVKVIAANGMNDGGCVLEMPDQVIDAGVDSQLRKIKTAIEDAMKSERE